MILFHESIPDTILSFFVKFVKITSHEKNSDMVLEVLYNLGQLSKLIFVKYVCSSESGFNDKGFSITKQLLFLSRYFSTSLTTAMV